MGTPVRARRIYRILLALFVVLVGLQQSSPAFAATTLTAEIVSWQIIGLDSNDPTGGTPELFLVQAQVTNTGAEPATDAFATISLTSPPCGSVDCVTLVSASTDQLGTIAPGETVDAFWTVRVAKTPLAFGTVTQVEVTAGASNAPTVIATQVDRAPPPCGSDATPGGTLLVEDLISQSRNDVISYTVSPGTQRADGSWEIPQGSSFTVTVIAQTATNYEEISVPATVDPEGTITPTGVSFTYELGTPSDDDIYTLNAGGQVTAVYEFSATSLGTVTLSQLIYDCSGNSFHYNSDYLIDSVVIHVVGTPAITMSKTSSPSQSVAPGDQMTFTINYSNTGTGDATNFVITDSVDPNLTNVTVADGGVYDPAMRLITWNIGTVPAGTSGSVSFTATVGDFAGGLTIRNFAVGVADGLDPVQTTELRIAVQETIPVTGLPSALLAILGWAALGIGDVLNSRRIESLRNLPRG